MARSIEEYTRSLQSLLPKGKLWNRLSDSVLTGVLKAIATELVRLEERAEDLQTERDSRYTMELLDEFEEEYELPSICTSIKLGNLSIPERRLLLQTKYAERGGQSPQYFIDLATALGYTITIQEHKPGWCGEMVCGEPLGPQENLFKWTVQSTFQGEPIIFACGTGACGDPLQKINSLDLLECEIVPEKPAHTLVLFDYIGPAFSRAFSSDFDSIESDSSSYRYGAFSRAFDVAFDVYYGGGFSAAFDSSFNKPA